ncbi:MAG: NADH oxidoreductase (quinone) subunit F [Gemmatimonadetes bacterium 13_1_40CM_4_69_8]|nr:MAG: NADH oxidoreductase (quinone) subunit F [Gemmatimonadetes bacterium 13_1_40CM_70_15]OLC73256.1 MAG: NADH oxidoreductase (quinone) subunit F [Gemmatimonadetes bacterium 13_1_40CM_4_69_8]
MGYPHKPHPRETVVLSKHFGDPEARTYKGWVRRGGYEALKNALATDPAAIIEEVKTSGLRGRGGAGFPTGLKWSFMPKEKTKPHYLCVNADESEPGTFKDREIMRWTPHALLEGTAIAAHAIRAEVTYIYVRGEFTEPLAILEKALAEASTAGVFGNMKIYLHRGAGAYICGEETAMMNSIEGKRGNPRIKPPFPAAAGVFGMPTTINNVETLVAVPHILKNGAAWYKGLSLSNPKSTGTKLFSVCGHLAKPGNYEVTMGFPLKDLLYELGGGMRPGRTLKACIPGGSSVPILNREESESCLLDYEGCVEKGTMLGSGGVIVFDDSTDMVYQIMRLARFYAHESCAQCTQCREGTAWTTRILERILTGQGAMKDLDLLLDLADNMTGKTICVLSDSCAAPVVSGIKKFKSEFEAYITGKKRPVAA